MSSRSAQRYRLMSSPVSRSSDAGFAGEIHSKRAEPMAAFVVLSGHGGQCRGGVDVGLIEQACDPPVAGRQTVGDALQHPRAAQVETVEMRKLRIGPVGHKSGLEPDRLG